MGSPVEPLPIAAERSIGHARAELLVTGQTFTGAGVEIGEAQRTGEAVAPSPARIRWGEREPRGRRVRGSDALDDRDRAEVTGFVHDRGVHLNRLAVHADVRARTGVELRDRLP
jgi:hypothetical protein